MVADASVEAGPDATMTFTISLGRITLTALTVGYRTVDGTATAGTDYTGVSGTLRFAIGEQSKTVTVQVLENGSAEEDGDLHAAAVRCVGRLHQWWQGHRDNHVAGDHLQQPCNRPPSVSGTAQVGETLTADTTGIGDADGLTNPPYSYQWIRSDGSTDTDIAGATARTYLLTASEMGKAIKVAVSFTDDEGNAEMLTSAATGTVAPKPNTAATGAPTITGTVQVGETLTSDTSGISDAGGLDRVSYSYQWIRVDGSTDTNIDAATGSTYALTEDDQGKTIKVNVVVHRRRRQRRDADQRRDCRSGRSAHPFHRDAGQPAQQPRTGQAPSRSTMSFTEEPKSGFSYKILRNHAFTVTGGDVRNAARLNRPSNIGWRITVRPTTDGDVTITLPSTSDCDAVGAICTDDGRKLSPGVTVTVAGPEQTPPQNSAATGPPTISGTAEVEQTLTADTSGISDADGLDNVSYTYQWVRDDGSNHEDITSATGITYTLVS